MIVKIKVNKKTHEIEKITGDIGHTAQVCAGLKLIRHEVEPTFGYKLRRFMKRLYREISYQADVACGYIVGSEQAADVAYIGIESRTGRW